MTYSLIKSREYWTKESWAVGDALTNTRDQALEIFKGNPDLIHLVEAPDDGNPNTNTTAEGVVPRRWWCKRDRGLLDPIFVDRDSAVSVIGANVPLMTLIEQAQ